MRGHLTEAKVTDGRSQMQGSEATWLSHPIEGRLIGWRRRRDCDSGLPQVGSPATFIVTGTNRSFVVAERRNRRCDLVRVSGECGNHSEQGLGKAFTRHERATLGRSVASDYRSPVQAPGAQGFSHW